MNATPAKPTLKKRINRVKEDGVVVRYLTEKMFKKVVKRQPVRIVVGGVTVEIRSKNQKELKQIAAYQKKIKELKEKMK